MPEIEPGPLGRELGVVASTPWRLHVLRIKSNNYDNFCKFFKKAQTLNSILDPFLVLHCFSNFTHSSKYV